MKLGDKGTGINTSVDVQTLLVAFMEDFHTWGLFISCTIIRISGGSAFRLMEFYCEWDFKMKNTTKHQCKISCSSPVTYPRIYASYTGEMK